MPAPSLDAATVKLLESYPFPGNVRELKNVIERALIESGGLPVRTEHLQLGHGPTKRIPPIAVKASEEPPMNAADLPLNLEAAENLLIRRALNETGGNIAEAARRLGINRARIYRKLGEINQVSEVSDSSTLPTAG